VNQRFKVRYIMDNVDEQIDTVSRAVLALTVSCARCHDHKFDPIPTTDYYALAGIFRSSDLCAGLRNKMGGGGLDYYDTQMLLHIGTENHLATASVEKIAEAKKAVEEARAEFQALRDSPDGEVKAADGRPQRAVARQKLTRLEAELAVLADPGANGPIAVGMRDSKTISDTEVRIRGEAEKLGPVVPRGFLGVLQFDGQPSVNPEQSGRLELAAWLTDEKNPLTSRVIVNRIWQHLFGAGLVKTVDNFGVTGDVPSHPELLDHLANRFVRDGWSIKKLVRTIVLTRAYQLSSDATTTHVAIDPANRLVWRHSPRRLDAEELRDATLAAAGKLNLTRPEASPAKDFKVTELRNNGPEAGRLAQYAAASPHRSVYLPLLRLLTPISLSVFDFAEQGMVTGSRDTTTVAPQALYLLNDPFVRRQSLTLAERLLKNVELDDAARIHLAYQLTVSRPPTSQEVERAVSYLAEYEAAVRDAITVADTVRPKPGGKKPPSGNSANSPTNQSQNSKPPKKPEPVEPLNPDEPVRTDEQAEEQAIRPANAKAAAWASFCQALLGASEFRYLK
ncbi:MAG: DUF1553 domain-containing protein, partial [Planctomycetales bacterium]|nr:DUF1553 domain-containing protein [Planctomycetales bacterium]